MYTYYTILCYTILYWVGHWDTFLSLLFLALTFAVIVHITNVMFIIIIIIISTIIIISIIIIIIIIIITTCRLVRLASDILQILFAGDLWPTQYSIAYYAIL